MGELGWPPSVFWGSTKYELFRAYWGRFPGEKNKHSAIYKHKQMLKKLEHSKLNDEIADLDKRMREHGWLD